MRISDWSSDVCSSDLVQFNIGAEGVGENLFEVVLKIDVKSKSSDGTAFVIELQYAGLFGVRNVPEDQLQPFFLAEAPRILFPFARRVIADAVRDGGFPPLLLEIGRASCRERVCQYV